MEEEGLRASPQRVWVERLRDQLVGELLVCGQRGRLAVRKYPSGQRVADDVYFFNARVAFGLQIAKKRGGKAQVKSAGQRQDVLVDQCFEDERAAKGARRAVLPEVLDAGEDLRLPRIEAQLAQDLWSNLRAGETI